MDIHATYQRVFSRSGDERQASPFFFGGVAMSMMSFEMRNISQCRVVECTVYKFGWQSVAAGIRSWKEKAMSGLKARLKAIDSKVSDIL